MKVETVTNKDYIERILKRYPFSLGDHSVFDGRYTLAADYLGEVRFGPPYFSISVLRDGVNIWADSVYGGEIFNNNIISERHHKLTLVKWFSSANPDEQRVVEIDLRTCKEKYLTGKGRYFYSGHFYSFDGIYYSKSGSSDIACVDLETQEEFLLNATFHHYINDVTAWGLSTVENTVLVFTKATNENIILFDLKEKRIVRTFYTEINLSVNSRIFAYLDKENQSVLIEYSDYDLTDDDRIINERKEYRMLH